MENQVEATEEALQLLKEIVSDHGPVIFSPVWRLL
jgi:uncharacterized protein (DUF779 family)